MADDSSDGSEKDRNAPTVRDLRPVGSSGDTVPDIIGQYVPPRPLPEVSQHRTLDLQSVRISEQADPRRALTERRLVSPTRAPGMGPRWWLVGGLAVLVGVAAWLLFRARPSSGVTAPAIAASPAIPAPRAPALPARATASAALAPASPAEVAPSPSEPLMPRDGTADRADAPAATSATKSSAPREPEKKRREPWLE